MEDKIDEKQKRKVSKEGRKINKTSRVMAFYLEQILFFVVVLLVLFALSKNIVVGIIGALVVAVLFYLFFLKKKEEDVIWKKRLQNVSFSFSKLVKKALIELPIPICILEFDGTIYWSNRIFDEMVGIKGDRNAIGLNIEDLIGDITLRKVLDEKKVIEEEFEFRDRKYILKYSFTKLDDQNDGTADYKIVMYWLDRTEYEKMKQNYEDSREAIMLIEIDGYEDVLKSTPEFNRPMLTMDIETLVSNIENETKGMIEKMANDKYIVFMKKNAMKELEKSKFTILDKARDIDYGNSLPVTFSIGVGYDGETIQETGAFASGALDMALGRGGDQVAIKNREGFNFFGGKSKGFERKTKVKSRLIGLALKEVITQSKKILIMGHQYPDMDAMGAAVGVYDICKAYGKKAHVVFERVNEAVEIFVDRLNADEYYDGMYISHEKAIEYCDKNTLVIIVDTHRPSYTECRELLDKSNRVVVIDHHRRGVEYINDTILLFHEIYVSSTCEMITELIQYTDYDIKIHKLTAEGLLGGIYLDTKNFEFKTGVRTFEAASYLRSMGADTISVKKFFNSYAEDFLVKAEIIQRTEIINERICISYSEDEIDNINIVIAKAADELLNIKKIEASFVLGKKGDTVFISARSLGDINVHILMEKIGGGGHLDIAGAQLKNISVEDAYAKVKSIIEEFLREEEEDKYSKKEIK